jgi:hypothetical protein
MTGVLLSCLAARKQLIVGLMATTAAQKPFVSTRKTDAPKIDGATRAQLALFRPVVAANLDAIVEGFLEYVAAWPEMQDVTESAEGMACLKKAQGQHLLNLFSGEFDEGYFMRVSRMGQAHDQAGLEPRWYLGAYGHVLKGLVELAIEDCADDPRRLLKLVSAINRVVETDMSFAVAALDPSPQPDNEPKTGIAGVARAVLVADTARARQRH